MHPLFCIERGCGLCDLTLFFLLYHLPHIYIWTDPEDLTYTAFLKYNTEYLFFNLAMILNNTQLWNNNQEILQVQLQTGIVHVHWSEFYITIYSFLGNSEKLFAHSCIPCCLSNWNGSNTRLNHTQAKD